MPAPAWLPVREELRDAVPYGAPQLEASVRLDTNENPYGPSPAMAADVAQTVARVARDLNRYPDREARALREDLAVHLSADTGCPVSAEQVWAANGSNEVMLQLMQAFGGPGRAAVSFAPTYSMYPQYARDSCTRWVEGRRADDFALDLAAALALVRTEQPALVVLTSPNNPTGTVLPAEHLRAVLDVAPGIVVVDEAYVEFRRASTPSAVSLLSEHRRLVVTRTMSKAFALAGGRLGYLAADPAVVEAVRVVRLPYHLSAVTQEVARVALRHAPELLGRVDELRETRDDLVSALRALGVQVPDSDANFVLFGRFADRHAVWQALLDAGVLVRETGPPGWLRVCVGTPDETTAFLTALEKVLTP